MTHFPGLLNRRLRCCAPRAPEGERWIQEIKFDSYRTQIQLRAGPTRALTRRGYDRTTKFTPIMTAVSDLAGSVILDGKIIVSPR